MTVDVACTAEVIIAKTQVNSGDEGIFKRIIGGMAKGLKNVGSFPVEHKEEIIAVTTFIGTTAAAIAKASGNNSGSGQSNSKVYFDYGDTSLDYVENINIDENLKKTTIDNAISTSAHASSCEHEVLVHSQRYHTKNGIEWRKKVPYSRIKKRQ